MKYILYIALLFHHYSLFSQYVIEKFVAGDTIVFRMKGSEDVQALLSVRHSNGSTLLIPEEKAGMWIFTIPAVIASRSGLVHLTLLPAEKWTKTIEILPDTATHHIEAYAGPKHLIVDRDDYSMITTLVLDQFDNPFPEKTLVVSEALMAGEVIGKQTQTSVLSTYAIFYAPDMTGYGALKSSYEKASSKEFRLDFYANDPANYRLYTSRQHEFADGNQLVEITTSTINDRLGNQVENGTMVYFQVRDTLGYKSIATAETINGVARFEMPAPVSPTSWLVTSMIPNYAAAVDTLAISFKKAFLELPVKSTSDSLVIGPIKSFMGQHAKYGLILSFSLTNDQSNLNYQLPIQNGMASLHYKRMLVPRGKYRASVRLGTLINTFQLEVP